MSNKMALDALTKILKTFEQDEFEDWLEATSPSGDVEQVQRQWENSSVYIRFCAKWADAFAAIAARQAEPQPSAQGPEEIFLQLHGDCLPHETDLPVVYTDNSVTWCWHRIHDSDVRYIRADLAQTEPQGWMPIETAPEKTLVICMWLDDEDTEHPERYAFDLFDDGLWQNYFNEHEHYLIAGAAKGRSEEAPYTHWTPIPATPPKE